MTGRPSSYTEEIAARVCAEMAEGKSLRSICRDEALPPESTVRNWAVEDREGFAARYARAREAQMDALAEDLLDIADDGSNDTYTKDDGTELVNHDHIARSKLRVDTRKWLMAKIAPKKYGEKLDLEHSGAVQISRIEHVIVKAA